MKFKVPYRIHMKWGILTLTDQSLSVEYYKKNITKIDICLIELLEIIWVNDRLAPYKSYKEFVNRFEYLLHDELICLDRDFLIERLHKLSINSKIIYDKSKLADQVIADVKEKVKKGNQRILKTLLTGALKWSPGHLSVLFQNYQFLETFNHVDLVTCAGNSLLHFACMLGFDNYASLLVSNYGYDIYERNKGKLSPIEITNNLRNSQLMLILLNNHCGKSSCSSWKQGIVNNLLIHQFESFNFITLSELDEKIPLLQILIVKRAFLYDINNQDCRNSSLIKAFKNVAILTHRHPPSSTVNNLTLILKSCFENHYKGSIIYNIYSHEINQALNICFENINKNPLWIEIAKTIIIKNPIELDYPLCRNLLDSKYFCIETISDPKLRQACITCLVAGSLLRFQRNSNNTLGFILDMIKNAGEQEVILDDCMKSFLKTTTGLIFEKLLMMKFNLQLKDYFNMVHQEKFNQLKNDIKQLQPKQDNYCRLLPDDLINQVAFYSASSQSTFVEKICNERSLVYNHNSITK